jgi:hypothetical protein
MDEEVYDLDRLLKDNKYDITHRGRIYHRIVKKLPDTIKSHSHSGRGRKTQIIFKTEMYPAVLIAVQSTKKEMTITGPGYIYAFLSSFDKMGGSSFQWLKVGSTTDHVRRMKQYKGPQAPRTIIGIYTVDQMKQEEDSLIELFDKLFDKTAREWYHCSDTQLATSLITRLFRNKPKVEQISWPTKVV